MIKMISAFEKTRITHIEHKVAKSRKKLKSLKGSAVVEIVPASFSGRSLEGQYLNSVLEQRFVLLLFGVDRISYSTTTTHVRI